MLTESKARMTPEKLKAFEAFELLSWNEQMAIMRQPISSTSQQEATQLATSPKKKQRNQKTRQQYKRRPLQQANPEQCSTENLAEKPTANYNISTVNTSQLPTTLNQAIKQLDREPPHSSSKVHGCNSFRLRFLTELYHYALLASLPGYIRFAEEMKATGQG